MFDLKKLPLIGTMFGERSAKPKAPPAFELTLKGDMRGKLRLNQVQFDFMRDNGLLHEDFLKKVAERMPNGGKQTWELLGDRATNMSVYNPVSLDVVTKAPLVGLQDTPTQTQTAAVRIESFFLLHELVAQRVLSEKAKRLITRAGDAFRKEEKRGFTGGNIQVVQTRDGAVGVSIYESEYEHWKRTKRQTGPIVR